MAIFNEPRIADPVESQRGTTRMSQIDERLLQIEAEVESDSADMDALLSEVKGLKAERSRLLEIIESTALPSRFAGTFPGPGTGPRPTPFLPGQKVRTFGTPRHAFAADNDPGKAVYRGGENLTNPQLSQIDTEKCLRAAITGNYSDLNESEKRSITPASGGAMLAAEVSNQLIDNLRQSDWMQIFQPTIVRMREGETKIPNITGLPTAIMHIPGMVETPTDPTITAATLSAKTIMVLVEVANELLNDASTSHGIIVKACTDALSNMLLHQVLYGTGSGAEMKGITKYAPSDFADSGNQSSEADLYRLVTLAKMAIIQSNGMMDAMLYDPQLEDRFERRTATGERVQPCRAFDELYQRGKVLAHPSVAGGDMIFMQADALYMGFREGMKVETDPYSAFNSNNTKFRLIMRGDIFANVARMVYYSGIPAAEA
jgi:HK97 family phage major capsid protein